MTNSQGFVDFMEQHQQPMLRFAMVLCGDGRLAEELVAEALARAYERWPRISHLDNPNAYIRRMILNDFLSRRRRSFRTVLFADVAELEDDRPDHASGYAEREAMVGSMRRLPRQQRATLVLRFYEGLSDEEIASLLGCSQSTVRSNAARALAALRIQHGVTQPRLAQTGEF